MNKLLLILAASTAVALSWPASAQNQPAPFQPGHQGAAPTTLTPTPAEDSVPRARIVPPPPGANAASAAAAAPAVTPAVATAGAPNAGAAPRPVTTMSPQMLDDALKDLGAIQAETEASRARLELLTTRQQIDEISRQQRGNTTGLNQVPQLVGIMSTKNGVVAEFLAGGALLQVAQGEMVSPEWRLAKVDRNSVEIARNGGRERHILMFGGSARTP